MKVKVKRLNENAVIPYKTYNKDFCYDVVATSCEEIAPQVYKYGIGLAFQIDRSVIIDSVKDRLPDGIVVGIGLHPRSSVWETGLVLSCCRGTIDELFTDGVSAVFYHVLPNMPIYKVGDRIGQIALIFTLPIQFVEVEELDETDRGANGYGSTGK